MQTMAVIVNLKIIRKKALVFKCIIHKKPAVLEIVAPVIIINACCQRFHDHIECFIERQIDFTGIQESQKDTLTPS